MGPTTIRSIKIIDDACIPNGKIPRCGVQELYDQGFAIVGEIFHTNGGGCDGTPTWLAIVEK